MVENERDTGLRGKLLGFYGVNQNRHISFEEIQPYALAYMQALRELIASARLVRNDVTAEQVTVCAMLECVIVFHEAKHLASTPEDLPARIEFINGTTTLPPLHYHEAFERTIREAPPGSFTALHSGSGVPIFPSVVRYVQHIEEQDADDLLAKAREKILSRVYQ